MSASHREDDRAVLSLLGRVGSAADDIDTLARTGVEALCALVPAEITTLSVCDLAHGRRRVVGGTGVRLRAEDEANFERHFHEHPLVLFHGARRGRSVHRISDSVPFARFRESALYSDYYRRVGIDHAIALPLHVDDRSLVSFVLNRSGRDFDERDFALLESLRPTLAALYRQAVELQRMRQHLQGLTGWLDEAGRGWLALDADGVLLEASAQALAWLGQALGRAPAPGLPLPDPLGAWLARGAVNDPTGACETRLARRGGALRLRRVPVPRPSLHEGTAAYLLVELERADRAPRFSTPVLTPREREVLHWLAAGKTDREIGTLTGCSPRTVQKHLQHVYVKLGVETRTAAVMRALAI